MSGLLPPALAARDTGQIRHFHFHDHELALRHQHKVVSDILAAHDREQAGKQAA